MIKIAKLSYEIKANDFINAGEASSKVKNVMKKLGINSEIIKKTVISMYEAEINAVIHGGGGIAEIELSTEKIVIKIIDQGKGIEDIEKAMEEGYSTATDEIREMGFGAGMGLPNMKRLSDEFSIESVVNKGTKVTLTVYLHNRNKN